MWRTLRSIAALMRHNITQPLHEARIRHEERFRNRYPARFDQFYGNMHKRLSKADIAARLPIQPFGAARSHACCPNASVEMLPDYDHMDISSQHGRDSHADDPDEARVEDEDDHEDGEQEHHGAQGRGSGEQRAEL